MTSRYRVEVSRPASRQIEALDKTTQARIVTRLEGLEADPRPNAAKKLKGEHATWRIRVGDYRIVYTIEDNRLLILVVKVGHRREVYS